MKLYIDFAKEWDVVVLAVACYPDRGGLKPLFKKVEVKRENTEGYNNYHCMLLALKEGMVELEKWLSKNGSNEEITIVTQHKQMLDWVYSRRVGPAYQEIFSEVMGYMQELSTTVDFKMLKVDRKQNKASNLVVNEKLKLEEEPVKLDFGGSNNKLKAAMKKASNGDSGDNIIHFDKIKL